MDRGHTSGMAHAVKGADRVVGRAIASLAAVAMVAALGNADSASGATHTQAIHPGNSLNAVSCVPGTSTCVVADSAGDALYATDVSATAAATWSPWNGPNEQSPSEAVECPASTLCLLAAGKVEGGGGNLYRATTLGGAFLTSFLPAHGVGAISCPSASFCVTAHEGGGFIRYSTNPSGIIWSAVSIGSGAMTDVSCLSSSFCAVVDDSGNVHVATTEQGVKEAAGWTSTNVDGTTAVRGIACSSTTSCVAVDGSGEVIELTIAPDGKATASREAVDRAKELTAVFCTGATCALADGDGSLFSSTDGGAAWTMRYGGAAAFTSVSCASASLCVAVTTSGNVTTFDPTAIVAPLAVITDTLPGGTAGTPYGAQVEAVGGTPVYRWSATGLPPGLSIDQASGRIAGTPLTAVCVRSPCSQPPASYTVTVTATDSAAAAASRQLTISLAGMEVGSDPGPAAAAPVVTGLKASKRVWRVGGGTTFSFGLNVEATVELDFTRRVAGRKVRTRCVARTSGNRNREACRREVHAGSLSFSAHPGLNKVAFSGRIPGAGKLKPGRYLLTLAATGSDGRRSAPASLSFRVLRQR
jgi:Putative Ig domain